MDTLWDRVKKNLVEWYGTAYEKTDELARIGKKKVEIAGVNRAIEKHLTELGGRVYDLIEVHKKSSKIGADEKVVELISEIKDLEEQLKTKEAEIEAIKEEKRHIRKSDQVDDEKSQEKNSQS
jgi:hypothetical protein